jgi:hypothetical protein
MAAPDSCLGQCSEYAVQQAKFLYDLWQATEMQVRSLEISVLTATGAIFAWLATRPREERVPSFAWWLPALITGLAGIRAGTLGLRQLDTARLLESNDAICLAGAKVSGWAATFLGKGPWVTLTAVGFYLALFAFDAYVALNYDALMAASRAPRPRDRT